MNLLELVSLMVWRMVCWHAFLLNGRRRMRKPNASLEHLERLNFLCGEYLHMATDAQTGSIGELLMKLFENILKSTKISPAARNTFPRQKSSSATKDLLDLKPPPVGTAYIASIA